MITIMTMFKKHCYWLTLLPTSAVGALFIEKGPGECEATSGSLTRV